MLHNGFEEIEALTTCDILRRAGIPCALAGYSHIVDGTHGIEVVSDISFDDIDLSEMDALILPGGMPGVNNLDTDDRVIKALKYAMENNILVCAICAAPTILGNYGFTIGKKAVCYPGFESYLIGAEVSYGRVLRDGNMITSRGAGTAIDFALEIVRALKDDETAEKISKGIVYEQA